MTDGSNSSMSRAFDGQTRPVPSRAVSDFMSGAPHAIDAESSTIRALHLMRERAVRHLPVIEHGALVGLLSERDVLLSRTLDGERMTVRESMTPTPLTVAPGTPIEDVAWAMWRRGAAAAIVLDGAMVVGIFTATDAVRALAASRGSLRPPPR